MLDWQIRYKLGSMRVYCVIAHPEPHQRSFCHSIYRKAIETLLLNKHQVMSTDLYECGFTKLPCMSDFENPAAADSMEAQAKIGDYSEEILRFQSRIEWCTHLILFTPLHWLAPSAAIMAWWERVFVDGWAYSPTAAYDKGFLLGKKAMVVVTTGMEQSFYGKDCMNVSIEELMYNVTFRCFAKCGFTPLRTQAFFGLQAADPQLRVDMLNAWAEHVMNLESREQIQFNLNQDEPSTHIGETEKVTNHKILSGLGDMKLIKPKDPYAIHF